MLELFVFLCFPALLYLDASKAPKRYYIATALIGGIASAALAARYAIAPL